MAIQYDNWTVQKHLLELMREYMFPRFLILYLPIPQPIILKFYTLFIKVIKNVVRKFQHTGVYENKMAATHRKKQQQLLCFRTFMPFTIASLIVDQVSDSNLKQLFNSN